MIIVKTVVFPVVLYGCESWTAAAAAKSLQSCPTLSDPIDGSPPGSAVPEISQATRMEKLDISFTRGIFLTQELKPELATTLNPSIHHEVMGLDAMILSFFNIEF